jgi:hypothetical protein
MGGEDVGGRYRPTLKLATRSWGMYSTPGLFILVIDIFGMLLMVHGSSPEVRDIALKSLYYRFAVEVKVDVQHLRLSLVKRVGTAQVIV